MHGTKYGDPGDAGDGGGSIINWASLAGLNASPMSSMYSTAKAGVIAVTKATALEYGPDGIHANVICPGVITTEIMGAAGRPIAPGARPEGPARTRRAASEEVAEAGVVPRLGPGVVPQWLRDPGRRRVVMPARLNSRSPVRNRPTEGPAMTTTTTDLYYDPYDRDIDADPYPVYRRLREEAPLYYNEEHDFYAVSRFDDVQRGLVDRETYSSARGSVLEFIKANIEMPPGVVIFEDPPQHTVHRGLLSRVFTPKKMNALEPKVREFCARALDPLVGAGRFDFVADLGAQMPMRTIGMLLGIPEPDQEEARRPRRTSTCAPIPASRWTMDGSSGRATSSPTTSTGAREHPSDDLMTRAARSPSSRTRPGTTRRLTRDEVLIYVSVLSGAGNETTNRLIGWMGKVLAEHPEQRRELVEDRSLVPERHRGAPAVRAAHAPRRPLRDARRRAARHRPCRPAAP